VTGVDAREDTVELTIRDAEGADERRWRELWRGYNEFYGQSVPDEVTNVTWQRIVDPAVGVLCRLAEHDGVVVGFTVSVVHHTTWEVAPECYLEDLFVDPSHRGGGAGRRLIADLVSLGTARGWSRLYWHTQSTNPARHLYDQFADADDFVRYRLRLGSAAFDAAPDAAELP
jgi:GNAT superfamily N-acetyltransferase